MPIESSAARIMHDAITDPVIASALKRHASERSRLLAGLEASFQRDERVRAAWLWGSFLRGEQDDLSDLDIWLLTPPSCVAEFGSVLMELLPSVVSCGENKHNAPAGGGYLGALIAGSHGLHHLDIYWQPVGSTPVPDGPVLVNRLGEPFPECEAVGRNEESGEKCVGRISFVWLMLSVTAKCLARNPSSDMSLIVYPRPSFEEAVGELGLGDAIGQVNWTVPEDPLAKVALLRGITSKLAVVEEAARQQGLAISREANPSLQRYFDLVEGILLRFG